MTEQIVGQEQGRDRFIASGDSVVTLVLTADNHLGYATGSQHPRKREERLQRLRAAFQSATDFAITQGVDFFIQAGDLFDSTTPDEYERSFVAERLAQLKQAGIKTVALGGVHDTPTESSLLRKTKGQGSASLAPAPQMSYARLGALQYLSPVPEEDEALQPLMFEIRGLRIGICGRGVLAGQEGDPLERLSVEDEIEGADIALLVLHAPIEGLTAGSSLLDTRAQVSRNSIMKQSWFDCILAGYHHSYSRMRVGQSELVVAGATQHIDFSTPDHAPGFVFLGLAADGIRWCNHIAVDAMPLQRLMIQAKDLWPVTAAVVPSPSPTEFILERLRPLCAPDTMIQLKLEGEITPSRYHQLNLNQIRHYGEEHCFALAIDDSSLTLLPEQEFVATEAGERFSPRDELIALADEWIAATDDEQEKKAWRLTREELLLALDEARRRAMA